MNANTSWRSLAVFFTAVLLSNTAFSGPEYGDGLNITDKHGLKQGYWKIMGYMINDPKYSTNAIVEEGNYADNKKEGMWTSYWPNGKTKYEINYTKNRPNGDYVVYYDNGQVEESGTWDINKNVGDFKRFYPNGNPQQEFYFSSTGKRNGVQRYYYDNGQVAMEVNIVNGRESGILKRYWEDGSIKAEMELEDGKLEQGSLKKFKNSDPSSGMISKNIPKQKEEEAVEVTEPDLNVESPNQAERFNTDGHNVLYNKNQQITQIGEFKNSRLWNGRWHRYNNDGILVRIEIFRNGQYIGTGVIEEE